MNYFEKVFIIFGAAILIEGSVYSLLSGKHFFEALGIAALINCVTIPAINIIYQELFENFWILEIAVVIIEAIVIMKLLKLNILKSLLVSLISNAITAGIGFI
jgi:hypothetical protein